MEKTARFVITLSVGTVIAVGGVACRRSPAAPSPTQPPVLSQSSVQLTGRVLDGSEQPVPGARVAVSREPRVPIETISDGAGRYSLSISYPSRPIWVHAEKEGFDGSLLSVWVDDSVREATRDLRLYRIVRITAGDSVELSLGPDGPLCGFEDQLGDWTYCRRVRIVAPRSGELRGEAVRGNDPFGFALRVSVPDQPIREFMESFRVAVTGGSETIVEVLGPESARRMTLITALD
jgi:hypothetical protein